MKSTPSSGGDDDVRLVLVGECAQRQAAAEPVQALAVGQVAVGEHFGVHGVGGDPGDPQRDQAIVEQEHVAGMDIVDQAQIAHADLCHRRAARRRDRPG